MLVNRIISIVFILAVGATIFYLFKLSTINYETASIRTGQYGFILTVKGKRHSLVHDFTSLFEIKRYDDSFQYKIPRDKGMIRGEEVATELGFRKPLGTITIQNGKCTINLFTYNTNNKRLEADTWNGQYKLEWRQE